MAISAGETLERGTVVDGAWVLEHVIARGGTADVWRATSVGAPFQPVAVKVLRRDLAADPRHIQRMIAEAEITACLPHPHIVQFVDGGALPCRTPYVVLEYLEGETLRERLERGPVPLAEAIEISRQVGAALAAAHRAGVVHRDLKPDNVFLCSTGGESGSAVHAKVLDFGLSTSSGGDDGDAELVGTPRYMSPEQAKQRNDLVDRRSDVFAFGAVVYEMLSGRPAFDAEGVARLKFQVVFEEPPPLATVAPGLPEHVVDAVHRALEKRREDRFPRVADFLEALSGAPLSFEAMCLSSVNALSKAAASVFAIPARGRARSRWTVAAVAAALLAALGLALAAGGGDARAEYAFDEAAAFTAPHD
jgi:serine/threonine-protein kinase